MGSDERCPDDGALFRMVRNGSRIELYAAKFDWADFWKISKEIHTGRRANPSKYADNEDPDQER